MKLKLVLTAVFVIFFASLFFAESSKASLNASLATPITSPITAPVYSLTGKVSFRFFHPAKGWTSLPAANVSVSIRNLVTNENSVYITDGNGNYLANLVGGNYVINAPVISGIQFYPSSHSVILNQNTGGFNFVGTPFHFGL